MPASAGTDAFEMFTYKQPDPFTLLQQAAYGIAGAATDAGKRPDSATPQVLADLLEEVFQCIADEKIVSKFTDLQAKYRMPLKKLQFAVMRMLCILYREVRLSHLSLETVTQIRHDGTYLPRCMNGTHED